MLMDIVEITLRMIRFDTNSRTDRQSWLPEMRGILKAIIDSSLQDDRGRNPMWRRLCFSLSAASTGW